MEKKIKKIEDFVLQYPNPALPKSVDMLNLYLLRFYKYKLEYFLKLIIKVSIFLFSKNYKFKVSLPFMKNPILYESVNGKIKKYNHEEYYLPSVNLFSFLFKMIGSQFFKNLFEIQSKTFFNQIKTFSNKHKKTEIVFVVRRCFFVVKKIAKVLKKLGFYTVLISLEEIKYIDDYKNSFNLIISNVNNYIYLTLVLNQLNPNVIYIQAMMWDFFLAKYIIKKYPQTKFITEFYDITGIYAEPKNLKKLWSDVMVDGDINNETFIFENSNIILSRFSNKVIKKYKGRSISNHFTIQPTICSDTKINNKIVNLKKKEIKLVYIGNLIPKNSAHPKNLFPSATIPEAWRLILEDERFSIHVYNSPFRSFSENGMKEILNLKHKYKNLVFHEGIPHQEIIFEIRKYDFGLNVHTTDLASNLNSKMQWEGMGTKIFTYIEASLPVIVMKDSRGMSNFLKKHGLGFALKNNELKNLYDLIMNKSFINLKKNIIYFNNNLNFENYNAVTIKKIVNFVSSKN